MEGIMKSKKVLIAYFSWGGNTKTIAQKIQAKTNGDIFEIKPKKQYPSDYHQTTVVAKNEIYNKVLPELNNNIDISLYDAIFVGTPAWWYTMAPAVMTFLLSNDFAGKTIVPFITHGGGGEYNIASQIKEFAKGSEVLSPFVVYNNGDANTDSKLDLWLNNL